MKRNGILNPELLHLLASMGHTDYVTVCDRGFPIPDDLVRLDLSLMDDIPTVLNVLQAIAAEFVMDRLVITEEMCTISPGRRRDIEALLPNIKVETVSHVDFKSLVKHGKGVIRTGDTCPYTNVILVSG